MNESQIRQKMQSIIDFLEGEFAKIRSSRASVELLSGIKVFAYGSEMQLNQLGNIAVVDATLMTIQAYDKTLVPEIEKAIRVSNLGLNPVVDGQLIRIPLPPLSEERRQEFVKIVKQKAEDAKVSVRQVRHEAVEECDKSEKEGKMREDECKGQKDTIQKIVDEFNKRIDELFKKKSEELLKI